MQTLGAVVENRGSEAVPFGYVYVGRSRRAGFSHVTGSDKQVQVWQANWGLLSPSQWRQVKEALEAEGYEVVE